MTIKHTYILSKSETAKVPVLKDEMMKELFEIYRERFYMLNTPTVETETTNCLVFNATLSSSITGCILFQCYIWRYEDGGFEFVTEKDSVLEEN